MILEELKQIEGLPNVYAGEYVLYVPHNQIVLCGWHRNDGVIIHAWNRELGYVEGPAQEFRKIRYTPEEQESVRLKRSKCKGCGK